MALVDLFQISHNFRAFGVSMSNVFHCERANSGETAQDVNDAYANSILPDYRLLMTTIYTNTNLVCFNLGDPLDFHTQDLAASPGLRVALDSPSFIAAAVRFPTLNRLVRSGQKRFAGMSEGDYTDGVMLGPAQALVNNIADALIANWLASADSHHVCSFAIVKRECEEEDPVTEKCLKYRLPKPPDIPVFYIPNARQLNLDVSSQVSRKVF